MLVDGAYARITISISIFNFHHAQFLVYFDHGDHSVLTSLSKLVATLCLKLNKHTMGLCSTKLASVILATTSVQAAGLSHRS
jgi:hypothetical protein